MGKRQAALRSRTEPNARGREWTADKETSYLIALKRTGGRSARGGRGTHLATPVSGRPPRPVRRRQAL